MSISPGEFLKWCEVFGVKIGGGGGGGPFLPLAGGTMTGPIVGAAGSFTSLSAGMINQNVTTAPRDITVNENNFCYNVTADNAFLDDTFGLGAYPVGFRFAIKNTSHTNSSFYPNAPDLIDGLDHVVIPPQGAVIIVAQTNQWSVIASTGLNSTNVLTPAYSRQVPVNGFTITIGAGIQNLILVPASPLATGTIIMPAAPIDRQIACVSAEAAGVASLTVNPNGGQTIGDVPTSLEAGQGFCYQYNAGTSNWMPIYQPGAASGGVTIPQVINYDLLFMGA